jgi:hypothetical protein
MKNAVFWDVTWCGSCNKRRFGGMYRLCNQVYKDQRGRNVNSRVFQLLVAAKAVPSSPILVTLMTEAIRSTETSVITRDKRRNIPEDAILRASHCSLSLHFGPEYGSSIFLRNGG